MSTITYLVFLRQVCHEQVYHQHLIYRASLNLYPTTEQVMVNVLDFHLVMYHLHLDELNEHVVFDVLLYKVLFIKIKISMEMICLPST
jgi:hypothetical protein